VRPGLAGADCARTDDARFARGRRSYPRFAGGRGDSRFGGSSRHSRRPARFNPRSYCTRLGSGRYGLRRRSWLHRTRAGGGRFQSRRRPGRRLSRFGARGRKTRFASGSGRLSRGARFSSSWRGPGFFARRATRFDSRSCWLCPRLHQTRAGGGRFKSRRWPGWRLARFGAGGRKTRRGPGSGRLRCGARFSSSWRGPGFFSRSATRFDSRGSGGCLAWGYGWFPGGRGHAGRGRAGPRFGSRSRWLRPRLYRTRGGGRRFNSRRRPGRWLARLGSRSSRRRCDPRFGSRYWLRSGFSTWRRGSFGRQVFDLLLLLGSKSLEGFGILGTL
jgi:hypothetical protein